MKRPQGLHSPQPFCKLGISINAPFTGESKKSTIEQKSFLIF
ncbi:hypothetical protein CWATWH0402_568 [Crocosphaera watsonii WH 0402]|uniref:Uncharacterized protein n=3 Tax=Crocosphaera watsonii TaxID=263511 RepID=T2JNC0_CROWT|nr:hypothetical protein CWATWH0003_B220 [Crocosphaera watsonii WH 0003]CCQ58439.1 hypothetical protein CWATWH0005_5646 [Crocosphaera watsonii WH 0005]CCQ66534.1 hypothetical protein CWATWH0402_568 [Crocosphaera watsonii WH 0402]